MRFAVHLGVTLACNHLDTIYSCWFSRCNALLRWF